MFQDDPRGALGEGAVVSGRYRLRRRLGRGGFADTFLVDDLLWGDEATLKRVRSPGDADALRRERSVLASIMSIRLPRLRELGVHDGCPYYIADYISGEPLRERPSDPARVLGDIAEALDSLHQGGLRHGDVSPENILVTPDGHGMLIDLGAVVPLDSAAPLVGTPGLVAPELVSGAAGHRADLFALGRVFEAFDVPALRDIVAGLTAPFASRTTSPRALLEQLGRPLTLAPVAGIARTFVGRDAELERLRGAIDSFGEGKGDGGPFAIVGPRGVGKTRLLRELRLHAQRAGLTTCDVPRLSMGWDALSKRMGTTAGPDVEQWSHAARECERVVVFADDVPARLLSRFVRGTPQPSKALLLATSDELSDLPGGRVLRLAPLDLDGVEAWAPSLSAADRARLHGATGGLPREIEVALARVSAGEAVDLAGANDAGEPRPLPEEEGLCSRLVELCVGPRRLEGGELIELQRLGWVHMREGRPHLRPKDAALVERSLPDRTRRAHRLAAADATGARRVYHLYRGGEGERANALAQEADFDEDPEGWLEALSGHAPPSLMARALRVSGRAEAAWQHLQDEDDALATRRERALALLSLGRIDEAHEEARASHDAAVIARTLVRRGEFHEALRVVTAALAEETRGETETAALHENRGAALVYLDRRGDAEAAFDAADMAKAGGARTQIRRALYRGIAASRACDPAAAALAYGRALAAAEAADTLDLRATAVLNLATAQQQLGDWGAALKGFERAFQLATMVDASTTRSTSRFNLANLNLACGDERQASVWLEDDAARGGALKAARCIAEGERHELLGNEDRARASYEEAARVAKEEGAQREWIEARQKLGFAEYKAAEELRAKDVLARAWVLRGAEGDGPEALVAMESAREVARHSGDVALLAEVMTRGAEMVRRAGAPASAEALGAEARALWERIYLSLPTEKRSRFWEHPLRRSLDVHEGPKEPVAAPDSGFRRILEINKKLNSSLPTKALLEHALDAAIELSGAERGFILLAGKELRVSTARNMDKDQMRRPKMRFSRTIAEGALQSREPILTTNARQDPRFDRTESVHVMGLQSVACVPIVSPHGVLGALYVDQRFVTAHFDEQTLQVLMALADQVALALDAARLRGELEAKAKRLEQQSEEQARLLERREAALLVSRSELARLSGADIRTDYAPLIGRSAAMRAVFAMLDRLAGTSIPVWIEGESGTGKELIARALHEHGGSAGPFVALNCAAVPEHLLESQLFGHKRGAFTGATESRQGLFVAASGGTVFLDEIGELPLAMQAKLLRALQEREVQPVGADDVVPFDARVIAATNRDTADEVKHGRFREDLYFRLAVVTLPVPALRERLEDLPILVDALMKQASEELTIPLRPIHTSAMQALLAHSWPGNVRELANVIRRALVLADGDIRVPDLSLGTSTSAARSRAEFDEEEGERIRRALQQSEWNVSEAARRLSMARNTLYRRMKKLNLR